MRVPLLRLRNKKRLMIACVAGLSFLSSGIGVVMWAASTSSPVSFYTFHLDKLDQDVKTLQTTLQDTSPTEDNFNRYDAAVSDMISECHRLLENAPALSPKESERYKDRLIDVKHLCTDLIAVSTYGQRAYKVLGGYVLYHPAWPAVNTPEARQTVQNLSSLADSTNQALGHVSDTNVNDPAKSELQAQLAATKQKADQLSTEPNLSSADYTALQNQFNRDKTNFLNARRYYWINTIQLDRLEAAVRKLHDQFGAK